jgi:hypothetical protein
MVPARPLAFNGSEGEREVFEALRLLPDHVYVFHSVRWIGTPSSGRDRAQGEADFVVFDPGRGILVVEVKSGIIELEGRRWFQTNRATGERREIQDPEHQASTSKFRLVDLLRDHLPAETCAVFHAVWLPSAPFSASLPPNYADPMLLDRNSVEDPNRAIDEAFGYWEAQPVPRHRLSIAGSEAVVRALAPAFSLVVSIRSSIEAIDRQLVQLTSEQARVLEFLEEQDVALVGGPAGTGKTMLAVEEAKRLAARGDEVIVVCFNAALQRFLSRCFATPGVKFSTFHGLANELAPRATDDPIAAALDLLHDEDVELDFDHVLVDEAQDFEDSWIEALRVRQEMRSQRPIAAGSPRFLVFYDPKQLVQQRRLPHWITQADCRIVLRRNCRNTKQIAKTVERVGAIDRYRLSDVDGIQPTLHLLRAPEDQCTLLDRLVGSLLNDRGLHLPEIAVLTMETLERSSLPLGTRVGGHAVSDDPRPNELLFTTVRRFKGLEAKAVVLVDIDLRPPHDVHWRNRLYVGSSRATHELHLVAASCPAEFLKDLVSELFPGRKLRPSLRAIAKELNIRMGDAC